MAIKKRMTKISENKSSNMSRNLEAFMLNLRKLLQKLWKDILTSNLHAKDKAEILRFLILAFTLITQSVIFVWLLALILNHL